MPAAAEMIWTKIKLEDISWQMPPTLSQQTGSFIHNSSGQRSKFCIGPDSADKLHYFNKKNLE